MEKIILGLLMLSGRTIYEIKAIINTKLDSMCSNSSGSIHTAMNKLIQQDYVSCQVSGRKKIYTITALGKEEFMTWISQPMLADKQKNMELCKLFFGGMVNRKERLSLLDSHIRNLQLEYESVLQYKMNCELEEVTLQEKTASLFGRTLGNEYGIMSLVDDRSQKELTKDIYQYQMATLQHALDYFQFEIHWYEQFKEEIRHES